MLAMMSFFVSADWSKDKRKRSVYVADRKEKCVRKVTRCGKSWDLDSLLDLAKNLSRDGSVLIGIDVVLGVPASYWRLVRSDHSGSDPNNFVDWLGNLGPSESFFETAINPNEWRVDRPWFKVPKGHGGLKSFTSKVHGEMLRNIEHATGAKPLFAVSGIPGTVGSGTRELWKELIPHLSGDRHFAIWPFEGELSSLLVEHKVVLCETYPRLAYAAAFANTLPTGQIKISKTKPEARKDACKRIAEAKWVFENQVDLGDLRPVMANEDAFDAHFTAAAVLRCLLEGKRITHPRWIEAEAEGSMLMAGVVDPYQKG